MKNALSGYKIVAGVLTYAGVVENHAGMQKLGKLRPGLTKGDLSTIKGIVKEMFPEVKRQWIRLHERTKGKNARKAYVLVLRGILPKILKWAGLEDIIFKEFCLKSNDKKFLNTKKKVVQNKNARWNYNVADCSQEPDYANGKGTVHDFKDMPCASAVRDFLSEVGRRGGLDKLISLFAEANIYHAKYMRKFGKYVPDSGIGFHGDSERKLVIGANMGKTRVLEFQAFNEALFTGELVKIKLRDGDMYFMCETACGHDWEARSYRNPHYRHRAGFPKWLAREMGQQKAKQDKRQAALAKKQAERAEKEREQAKKRKLTKMRKARMSKQQAGLREARAKLARQNKQSKSVTHV